jgi:hypothetical protein
MCGVAQQSSPELVTRAGSLANSDFRYDDGQYFFNIKAYRQGNRNEFDDVEDSLTTFDFGDE